MSDAPNALWLPGKPKPDTHVAFRGLVQSSTEGKSEIEILSSCPFQLWLNGILIGEGPIRWANSHPESQIFQASLRAGANIIAIHAHYEGVDTRMMPSMPPFIRCGVHEAPVIWRCLHLRAFSSQVKRINPQFGWIDWCDTHEIPLGWHQLDFDDKTWESPSEVVSAPVSLQATDIEVPINRIQQLKASAHGTFTESFGYDADDPNAQFFLRDLEAHHGSPQGVWRRYDLGVVKLGRPRFVLNLPSGAIVEFALSESLSQGKVSPWITLSAGPSCNLSRFVARGGPQEFEPFTATAGRYMEIHVRADPNQVRFAAESFRIRSYHGDAVGSFAASDPRLTHIWAVGVDTYRACSEDSVIDNPTRERGEWIGDSLTVGLENAASAFTDLRLFNRALHQAAQCAREDGLVAGLCPGTVSYLSTYACHWTSAAWRLYEMTGDRPALESLHRAMERNMQAFSLKLTDKGLTGDLGWAFIDWGYVGSPSESEMGLNLIWTTALKSAIRWCQALDKPRDHHEANLARITSIIQTHISQAFQTKDPWAFLGLQRAVLALREDLIPKERLSECIAFIKRHYHSCFPNDPFGPNLANPETAQPRLITPFFSHFALSELWKYHEGDFVLDQYRTCWGWALDLGLTTWPEVFDLRWSHCHQWSGCPTWQLSRYVLGISVRQDLGSRTVEFDPSPCALHNANGFVPIPGSDHPIRVIFERRSRDCSWLLESKSPFDVIENGKRLKGVTSFSTTRPHGTSSG